MAQPFVFRGSSGARDGRDGRDSRRAPEFTFRATPSTRPLLRAGRRESTPDFLGDEPTRQKFVALEDLTDSEEEDMVVSSDSDDGQPSAKRRKVVEPEKVQPRWSNPDPYTALPPEEERVGKKRDFVKLIRKARVVEPAATDGTVVVTAEATAPTNAVVSNDDFISLAPDDLGIDMPPESAPSGPRAEERTTSGRKRRHDGEVIESRHGKAKSKFFNDDGSMLDKWFSLPGKSAAPWVKSSDHHPFHVGTMLHNEILDFYHWVKPTPYEDIIRRDLIVRLQECFSARFPGSKLYAFGSFASGMYLPIADMDLVLLSRQFMFQKRKYLCQRVRDIYSFAEFIRGQGLAVPGTVEAIAHARVPIIKFVDRLTGLKVDLSFDNNSGLEAIETFHTWKAEFTAMPVIVSVIKQFLLLRGLNEVPTGGLGGFSIICLVTSLLQHLPRGVGEPNLGSVLMDFFDFYGNEFDAHSVGIQLDPPGYFYKNFHSMFNFNSNKGTRLWIMDPNNPDNDISGGTKQIPMIFKSFSGAYQVLKEQLHQMTYRDAESECSLSLLEPIIGANYESYQTQRERLHDLFINEPRFARFQQLPSPPPPPPAVSPPPLPSTEEVS